MPDFPEWTLGSLEAVSGDLFLLAWKQRLSCPCHARLPGTYLCTVPSRAWGQQGTEPQMGHQPHSVCDPPR